jgi:two-component system sensor histidine kinase PilS (NtrC family)
MAEAVLIKRLKTLIAVRAFFVTILLGSFFVFHIGYNIFPYPYAVSYIISFLYALTIIYALLLGKVKGRPFAYVQLTLDVLSSMALIAFTGGIESWFNSLPLLIVIAAAIVVNKQAGYYTAILSSILYGSLLDLQYYSIIPIPYDPMHMDKDFFYNVFSHITALFLTAYLIGHLTWRLERKDIDLEDLSLFNKDVIENTPSGLFTTDVKGTVKIFNRAASEITGINRNYAVGRRVEDIFPFIPHIREVDRVEEMLETEKETKILGFTISSMKDAKGQETGFIGVFQDLTDLKWMEREIKRKENLAALGELSANIAHEIRNPLASLKGSIEILKEDSIEGDRRKRLMSIALDEMDRLDNILSDFLDYSRPKPPEIRKFDLHAALNTAVELLRNRNMPGVVFSDRLSDTLFIKADEQKLQQVFWNLGLNALEAMPGGGTLSVGTALRDGLVHIAFEDTGKGISPEDSGRIFYPFFTTRRMGTGLGLSIANRIVEDHGGIITVVSEPEKSTKFEVTIPRRI